MLSIHHAVQLLSSFIARLHSFVRVSAKNSTIAAVIQTKLFYFDAYIKIRLI